MKIITVVSLGSLVTASILAAGCAGKNNSGSSTGPDDNSDSSESSASSAQSSRLDQMIFSPIASNDPATAANNLASASNWWPAGCATRTKDATPGVVHVHLNECTGPFGLVHWTGDITVTFTKGSAADSVHAQASSNDMTVNGRPVVWSRDAEITVSGATRTVTGTGAWTREDKDGETVSHASSFTVVIDTASGCRTANGSATTKVGLREVDATVSNYKVCREPDGADGCPTGSVVFKHKLSGKTITISFDGSAQAKISNGSASIEYPLVCGG